MNTHKIARFWKECIKIVLQFHFPQQYIVRNTSTTVMSFIAFVSY